MSTQTHSTPAAYVAPAPSMARLVKAMLIALVVAAIVLVTAVLPAEYGIDPLGTGRMLGFDQLFAAEETAAAAAAAPATITAAVAL